MKRLMHILFLSCLKATELIEKKLHFKLSFSEKLQLKVHKMMCNACSNSEKQNIIIEKSSANQENASNMQVDVEQLKISILEKLSK